MATENASPPAADANQAQDIATLIEMVTRLSDKLDAFEKNVNNRLDVLQTKAGPLKTVINKLDTALDDISSTFVGLRNALENLSTAAGDLSDATVSWAPHAIDAEAEAASVFPPTPPNGEAPTANDADAE